MSHNFLKSYRSWHTSMSRMAFFGIEMPLRYTLVTL